MRFYRVSRGENFGMRRTTRRFAIVPVRLDNGAWLWWSWYSCVQQLEQDAGGWNSGEWIMVSRAKE